MYMQTNHLVASLDTQQTFHQTEEVCCNGCFRHNNVLMSFHLKNIKHVCVTKYVGKKIIHLHPISHAPCPTPLAKTLLTFHHPECGPGAQTIARSLRRLPAVSAAFIIVTFWSAMQTRATHALCQQKNFVRYCPEVSNESRNWGAMQMVTSAHVKRNGNKLTKRAVSRRRLLI